MGVNSRFKFASNRKAEDDSQKRKTHPFNSSQSHSISKHPTRSIEDNITQRFLPHIDCHLLGLFRLNIVWMRLDEKTESTQPTITRTIELMLMNVHVMQIQISMHYKLAVYLREKGSCRGADTTGRRGFRCKSDYLLLQNDGLNNYLAGILLIIAIFLKTKSEYLWLL